MRHGSTIGVTASRTIACAVAEVDEIGVVRACLPTCAVLRSRRCAAAGVDLELGLAVGFPGAAPPRRAASRGPEPARRRRSSRRARRGRRGSSPCFRGEARRGRRSRRAARRRRRPRTMATRRSARGAGRTLRRSAPSCLACGGSGPSGRGKDRTARPSTPRARRRRRPASPRLLFSASQGSSSRATTTTMDRGQGHERSNFKSSRGQPSWPELQTHQRSRRGFGGGPPIETGHLRR